MKYLSSKEQYDYDLNNMQTGEQRLKSVFFTVLIKTVQFIISEKVNFKPCYSGSSLYFR